MENIDKARYLQKKTGSKTFEYGIRTSDTLNSERTTAIFSSDETRQKRLTNTAKIT